MRAPKGHDLKSLRLSTFTSGWKGLLKQRGSVRWVGLTSPHASCSFCFLLYMWAFCVILVVTLIGARGYPPPCSLDVRVGSILHVAPTEHV